MHIGQFRDNTRFVLTIDGGDGQIRTSPSE
jgi:hypothetical protein